MVCSLQSSKPAPSNQTTTSSFTWSSSAVITTSGSSSSSGEGGGGNGGGGGSSNSNNGQQQQKKTSNSSNSKQKINKEENKDVLDGDNDVLKLALVSNEKDELMLTMTTTTKLDEVEDEKNKNKNIKKKSFEEIKNGEIQQQQKHQNKETTKLPSSSTNTPKTSTAISPSQQINTTNIQHKNSGQQNRQQTKIDEKVVVRGVPATTGYLPMDTFK
uniref:Uncharacterized protein n=1 Tax=Meloidogyne hapla TaxID=6305 RepID=A0A1I8B0K2_MELHA